MALEPILLCDEATGATAKILSGFGFNCYSFKPVFEHWPQEVLWSDPDFQFRRTRPSRSGIPLLFPFAGRIAGSHLSYRGRTYPLGSDDGSGNAIHGFVLNRPWRVIEHGANYVVGEFHASLDEPGLLHRWPADFRLTVRYEVAGNRLTSTIQVSNPDDRPLPFGLGTHGYFRVPLAPGGKAADCRLFVPAREQWELVDMLPSGRRLPADPALAHGLAVGDRKFDHVFTDLAYADGICTAAIDDAHAGRRLQLAFDDLFANCVVFTPPHRQAVCLEPYSCVPDAFALEEAGINSGLRFLEPGETRETRIEVTLTEQRS